MSCTMSSGCCGLKVGFCNLWLGVDSAQGVFPISPVFKDSNGMPSPEVHWGNVNELQVAAFVVNVDSSHEGAVLKFCQRGFGQYLVDNVVVVDLGPVGGHYEMGISNN